MASLLYVSHSSWWRTNYVRYCAKQRVILLAMACCSLILLMWNPAMVYSAREMTGRLMSNKHLHYETPGRHYPSASSSDFNDTMSADTDRATRCAHFPNIEEFLIVVKTGATEAFEKIPIQFITFLECVPEENVLVFSDMEQDVGPIHIYDALDEVSKEDMDGNEDFDLYKLQQEFKAAGIEVGKTLKPSHSDAAWSLDKYKNVHIAKKAYQMRPNKHWYVFIDADTYIVWPSIIRWLEQLNHKKPLYLGSTAYLGDRPFAHGGSGYVLSGTTMQKVVGEDPEIAGRYDSIARHECCGDLVLAMALKEKKIRHVRNVWPMINGEKPRTLPFGPSHWCQPISTMHHVTVSEFSDVWRYEHSRPDPTQPILLQDLFYSFFVPQLQHSRDDWDNTADDGVFEAPTTDTNSDEFRRQKDWSELEMLAHRSWDDCENACKANKGCFQWVYREQQQKCSLAWSMRIGSRQPLGTSEWDVAKSGWDIEKIWEWVEERGNCTMPEWVTG